MLKTISLGISCPISIKKYHIGPKSFFLQGFPPPPEVTTPSQRKVGCGGHFGRRRFLIFFWRKEQ